MYGELFQGTSLIASNDDSANQNNFCIVKSLIKGNVYYLKVKGYSYDDEGDFTIRVSGNWSQQLTNSNAYINSQLNRTLAREYMDKWYNGFNPEYKQLATDCANFVSQCLYAGGLPFEGAPTNESQAAAYEEDTSRWYYCPEFEHWDNIINYISGYSYTWTSTGNLQLYFGKNANGTIGRCYQYIEYTSPATCLTDIAYLANTLQCGDILQYTGPENHTMIVSKTIKDTGKEDVLFSAHTSSRLDASFTNLVLKNSDYSECTISIIRMKQN